MFPLLNLISPSVVNSYLAAAAEGDENQELTQVVLTALQYASMHHIPQTGANPNPERPLLRLANEEIANRAGPEISVDHRFHLPADRFAGCYQIPHWTLPPLKTLSMMAKRTFDTVLNHFSFVHEPTFKLRDAASCLAFAICTVGGIRSGKQNTDSLLPAGFGRAVYDGQSPTALDGPVSPDRTWESMYKKNFARNGPDDEDVDQVNRWDSAHLVRNEKTNMLMRVCRVHQRRLRSN